MSAFRWVRGFSPFHSGVDLAAATGTPIHAVFGGTVTWAGDARAGGAPPREGADCGIMAELDIGAGRRTVYCHMERVGVATGQQVGAGQIIGTVDTTGHATGPHVHFGLWVSGRGWVDPLSVVSLTALIAAVQGSGSGVYDQPAAGGSTPPAVTCAGSIGPCFPTGTAITDAMIHQMVDRWSTIFDQYKDPLTGGAAQAATLDVLRGFIGQPWNDATILRISQALQAATKNGGQDAALQVAGEAIAGAPAAIVGAVLQGLGAALGLLAPVLVQLGILVAILILAYLGVKGLLEPEPA